MECRDIRGLLATRRDLSLAQEQAVQAHLATCAACSRVWRQEEQAMRVLRAVPVPSARPPQRVAVTLQGKLGRPGRSRPLRLGGLVSVAVALSLILVTVLAPRDVVRGGINRLSALASSGKTGSAPGTTAKSNGVVTIGFAAYETDRQRYEPLIAAFNTQNPGIRVQFVSLDDIRRNSVNQNEGAQGAEAQVAERDRFVRQSLSAADTATSLLIRPDTIANGYLHDLRPFMDADSGFARNDFYPLAFEAAQPNAHVYSLPHTLYAPLLYYNKDLFAARGLPSPAPSWTWQDLLHAAEQLANKRGDKVEVYGLMELGSPGTTLFGALAAQGVDLFAGSAGQVRLDRPEVVAAVERVVAMVKSGALYIHPNQGGHDATGYQDLIGGQHAGMWQAGMLSPNPPGGKSGIAPYPASSLPSFSGSAIGYSMSAGTQHPREAWQWLSFLSHQELKRSDGPNEVSYVPARRSIAERSGYWSKLDRETAAAIKAVIERPAAPLPAERYNVLFPLNQALDSVLSGKRTAKEALQEAQTALERQPVEPRPNPNARPSVVATPQPEVAPEGVTTITYYNQMGSLDEIRRIAAKFTREHPEISIKIKDRDYSDGERTVAQIAATSDCFPLFTPPRPEEMTALLDLQPLIAADPDFKLDDYPAALLASYRQDGGLFGLPYAVGLRFLAYNQTAFDKAGIARPSVTWTQEDFVRAAQQLTGGTGDDKRYGFVGGSIMDVFFFLDRAGASTTRGSGSSLQPNFTDSKVVAALHTYLDLLHATSPNAQLQGYLRDNPGESGFSLFAQGRVGMFFGYGIGMDRPKGFTTAIAPPPFGNTAPTAHDFSPLGLHISAKTQHAAACWTWLKYLSKEMSALPDGFPARISMAESGAWTKKTLPGAAEVYQAYRAAWERDPNAGVKSRSFYESPVDYFWFFRAVDRALQGADLQPELQDAQSLTERFLACTRTGTAANTCATQTDPAYHGWKNAEAPRR
jgi:ABC-type glycerol-3-phosphate transport system substrate-binding protein